MSGLIAIQNLCKYSCPQKYGKLGGLSLYGDSSRKPYPSIYERKRVWYITSHTSSPILHSSSTTAKLPDPAFFRRLKGVACETTWGQGYTYTYLESNEVGFEEVLCLL